MFPNVLKSGKFRERAFYMAYENGLELLVKLLKRRIIFIQKTEHFLTAVAKFLG